MVKASLVILAWNSTDRVASCLASLSRELADPRYETIVVDNGSRDLTPAVFRERIPRVRIVTNRKNRGVATARNQGIRAAGGHYIVLLDDDTVVERGALERLLAYMDAHPAVGVCGPRLVDRRGQTQLSCRLFPTLMDKAARRFAFRFARPAAEAAELADWSHDHVREVDYVIGACQVIRRAALAEVGLLDERIFYGPEDIDICLRMRQMGWRVVYNPQAVVIHDERRAARSLLSVLAWRHLWGVVYYFWKHGYLFSRRRLYARIRRREGGPTGQEGACERGPLWGA